MADQKAGTFRVDPAADEAVRGALVTSAGTALWPLPPLPKPDPVAAPPPPAAAAAAVAPVQATPPGGGSPSLAAQQQQQHHVTVAEADASAFRATLREAALLSLALVALLSAAALSPPPASLSLVTVFLLACAVGRSVVAGVSPALHSPLMSVTNAVSGMTALGGLGLMDGGFLPATWAGWLAAAAVLLSAVNVCGGFLSAWGEWGKGRRRSQEEALPPPFLFFTRPCVPNP